MLRLQGLTKRFGTTVAVKDVSLDIPPGQMVGVIGRSGAGKSTLLRLINRLLEPTQGTVSFQGVNITALRGRDLHAWRARCAMIFQQFHLVNRLDVLTNVLLGRLSYHWTLPSLLKRFSMAERALALQVLKNASGVTARSPLPAPWFKSPRSFWPTNQSPRWIPITPRA